jgi:hypothetical protein
MGWFSNLFSGSVGTLVDKVGDIADEFHLSGEEKRDFQIKMRQLIQSRDSEIEQTIRKEMDAKEKILVAELTQGDTYTKRARPTVVYAGLLMIFLNYLLVPLISRISGTANVQPFELPGPFWAAWGGIVATWSIGRSFEKSNASNKFSQMVTGAKRKSSLLGDDEAVG